MFGWQSSWRGRPTAPSELRNFSPLVLPMPSTFDTGPVVMSSNLSRMFFFCSGGMSLLRLNFVPDRLDSRMFTD